MGAIQGSINSMLNTVAASAVAGKHLKDKKALEAEQGLLAKEQLYEASADLTKLEGEQVEAQKALDVATSKVEDTKGWDLTGKNASLLEGKIAKRLTEQEAADRAFKELSDRIEAKKAMISRAEAIMKRTGTWGGMR